MEDDIVPIDIVSCVACMVRASVQSGGGMQAKVKVIADFAVRSFPHVSRLVLLVS